MDTQVFYRQKGTTAKWLEEEVGYRSAYSRSTSSREGGAETQGMAEQRMPLRSANQFKQMDDEEIMVFYHNLPPFLAERMSWLKHPILRKRHAMKPPELSELPPLTPIELHSAREPADDDDEPWNPGDFE